MSRRITLLILLTGLIVKAQVQPVGTVGGSVRDVSGALAPEVKVTLRNIDTGVARQTLTNNSGIYLFPLVSPGRYEATVEKPGFARGIQELVVRMGIGTTADFTLQVGQVADS